MPDTAQHVAVRDNPDYARYEAWVGDALAGLSAYRLARGGRIVFLHTEIEPEFEGRGVGAALARAALDDARARGLAVVPVCTFIAGWIDRHPEYRDLVDRTAGVG